MPVNYIDKVNQRVIGSELAIFSETHQVGITSLNTVNSDFIRLIEVPLQESPSSVVIPGFSEVTTLPGTNEFKVDYENGRILFNSSKNGQFVNVDYKGRGSIIDAEDVNELQQIFIGTVTPGSPTIGIANLDGTLSDGILRPNNISTVSTDDFTFPRKVTIVGDLDVQGTTTSLQTEVLTIDDNIFLLNSNVTGVPTENSGFEVERGSSLNVTLQWNETNDSWQMVGTSSVLLEAFDTGVVSTPGILALANGTALAPSLTFTSDLDSGIFRPSADQLSITLGGLAEYNFTATSLRPVINGGWSLGEAPGNNVSNIYALSGTAVLPTYTFGLDINTGMFRAGADILGFSTAGTSQWVITSAGDFGTQNQGNILAGDGTVLSPGLQFNLDSNTGIYRIGNDILGFVTGGVEGLRIDASQNVSTGGITPAARFHNAGATVFGITTDTDPASIVVATVDNFTGINISTTGAVTNTLPNPTNTTAGRFFTVLHNDTSTGTLAINGTGITVGKGATFMWDATVWIPIGTAGGFEVLAGDPGSPVIGDTWYSTVDSQFKGYNGSDIVLLG